MLAHSEGVAASAAQVGNGDLGNGHDVGNGQADIGQADIGQAQSGQASAVPHNGQGTATATATRPYAEGTGAPQVGQRPGLGWAFWRFLCASGISYTGDGLVIVALPLLAYTLTKSPLLIAGVPATSKVCQALAGVPGGILADRADRRRVMWICNVASGLSLVVLLAAMSTRIMALPVVYVAAALIAAADTTYKLSMWGATPEIIADPQQLGRANGHLMAAQMSGEQFVGQAGGGVLFALSARLPFFLDTMSFFVSAGLIRTIAPAQARGRHFRARSSRSRHSSAAAAPERTGTPAASAGWVANFVEGARFYRRSRWMKLLTAYVGSAFFAQYMVFGVVVLYGRRALALSPALYGVFLTIGAALGVVGSVLSGRIHGRLGNKVLVFGLALMSGGFVGMALARQWVLAAVMLGLQDFGVGVANVGSVTARQRLIPKQLQGRVIGVFRLLTYGMGPLGAMLAGAITSLWGVRTSVLAAGVFGFVVMAVLGPVLLRALDTTVPEQAV